MGSDFEKKKEEEEWKNLKTLLSLLSPPPLIHHPPSERGREKERGQGGMGRERDGRARGGKGGRRKMTFQLRLREWHCLERKEICFHPQLLPLFPFHLLPLFPHVLFTSQIFYSSSLFDERKNQKERKRVWEEDEKLIRIGEDKRGKDQEET
jgi:hypothetical protein